MNKAEYGIMFGVEDRHWWYIGLRALVQDFWKRFVRVASPTVLDAGCGTGATLASLSGQARTVGIDFSPEAIQFCRTRGEDRTAQASVLALPFGDGSFDVVLSCDVLSNRGVTDKQAAIVEFGRVLKPGGLLLLNLPAYQWLLSSHDTAVQQDRRFSRSEVRGMLETAALRPERITYWNSLMLPVAVAVRLWRKVRPRPTSDLDSE